MKKKLFASLLSLCLIAGLLPPGALADGPAAQAEPGGPGRSNATTVYVGEGEDSTPGHYPTITEALENLPANTGELTIMLTGAVEEPADVKIPTNRGIVSVLITSELDENPVVTISGCLFANGVPMEVAAGAYDAEAICGGAYQEAVENTHLAISGAATSADGKAVDLVGGSYGASGDLRITGTSYLELSGVNGSFGRVMAGSYVSGDSAPAEVSCSIGETELYVHDLAGLSAEMMCGGTYLELAENVEADAEIGAVTCRMEDAETALTGGYFIGGNYLGKTAPESSAEIGALEVRFDGVEMSGADVITTRGTHGNKADIGSVNFHIKDSAIGQLYMGFYEGSYQITHEEVHITLDNVTLDKEASMLSPAAILHQGDGAQMTYTAKKATVMLLHKVDFDQFYFRGTIKPKTQGTVVVPWQKIGTSDYTISAVTDFVLGDSPDGASIKVTSPEGYLITSCKVNDIEEIASDGSTTLQGLSSGLRIVTEMKQLQTHDVIYVSPDGDDAINDGSTPETPVRSLAWAYHLLNNGGTIVVMGAVEIPKSTSPLSAKEATITGSYGGTDYGGRLVVPTPQPGPSTADSYELSIGANTTIDNLTVDCSMNQHPGAALIFLANGHDLTIGENVEIVPFPSGNELGQWPDIAAGEANIKPQEPGYQPAETGGTITVKSGTWSGINAAGFYPVAGTRLVIHGGVTVDYLDPTDTTNASIHIVSGSSAEPTRIGTIWSGYDGGIFDSLTVEEGGYLLLTDDSVGWGIPNDNAVKDLAINKGGTLEVGYPELEKGFTGNMTGGGTLILPSGGMLNIPGTIDGETTLEIIPTQEQEQEPDKDYVEGCALGVYVTSGAQSAGTFVLGNPIPATLQKNPAEVGDGTQWELVPAFIVTYDLDGGVGAEGVDYRPDRVLPPGGDVTAKAAPTKSGYTFTGWSDGTTVYQAGDTITVDRSIINLKAQWSKNGGSGDGGGTTRYTITADAGPGGRISPSGRVRVDRGDDQTFRITADDGYEIADVLVDGESVGAVSRYTFENVRTGHTIEAVFEEIVQPPDPEEPDPPVDPEDPDPPVDPEDPDQPTDPEDPDQPTDPEDPDQPTDPEDPDQPTDPEEPDPPVDPEDPDEPDVPTDPDTPTTGDRSMTGLWALLCLGSLAGLLLSLGGRPSVRGKRIRK